MKRYICIHGHFYQPPRENPWLEEIEIQDSAFPYRDWNDRITAECYAPNAASRILDNEDRITDIVNNYAKISFNFGPTLLAWMQKVQPDVYRAVLNADKMSQRNFSGCGSAMSQPFNHMIMPLANERDKKTQVLWGIKDFEHRFKRKPKGMWLPETAVDSKTLEIMADNGIMYTILAPGQALKVRRFSDKEWQDVKGAKINPRYPYLCKIKPGKEIVIFFYDGFISHDVAFGGLLNNGENFANRFIGAFLAEHPDPQIVHIATDGETYGHHHKFGNMALSYCLNYVEEKKLGKLTNYEEYLSDNPPEYEVQIAEDSSWSCAHGVERWRSDCGCHITHQTGWTQGWRKPLRETLDWLRDELEDVFEKETMGLCRDPWQMRDEYVDVVLDRSAENLAEFFARFQAKDLSEEEKVKLLSLLEMQRNAMYMYTSCGWFFDDISGIESVQVLSYAARAMQLNHQITQRDLENEFILRIGAAKSNFPQQKDGAEIYKRYVKPGIIDFLHVGAHYAISSLFENYPPQTRIYAYHVNAFRYEKYEVGKQRLVIGHAAVESEITLRKKHIDFVVLHFGDYNFNGGVRYHVSEKDFGELHDRLRGVFMRNDAAAVLSLISEHFVENKYTLWDLFRNEQGKVLNQIFENTLKSIEAHFKEVYDHYFPLMQIKPDFRISLPKALSMTVEFVLNQGLLDLFAQKRVDLVKLEKLTKEMKRWSFGRDNQALIFKASQKIDEMMDDFFRNPHDLELLKAMCETIRLLKELPLQLNFWRAQNTYFAMSRGIYKTWLLKADQWNISVGDWLGAFKLLGQYLEVKTD